MIIDVPVIVSGNIQNRGKSKIVYYLDYVPIEIKCWKVSDTLACRACFCRPAVSDGAVHPNNRHHPDHNEDRTGQYRL